MLCNTCQRQSHCLTHQLAAQDQRLRTLLERLQRCQQHQPQTVRSSPLLRNCRRWMLPVVQRIARLRA